MNWQAILNVTAFCICIYRLNKAEPWYGYISVSWRERAFKGKLNLSDGERISDDIILWIYRMIRDRTDISVLVGEKGSYSGEMIVSLFSSLFCNSISSWSIEAEFNQLCLTIHMQFQLNQTIVQALEYQFRWRDDDRNYMDFV